MPFLAAHPTVCIRCHEPITKGTPIAWTRGKGAQPGVYHVACPLAQPPTVTILDTLEAPVMDMDELIPDEAPIIPDEPRPGTRKWFETAATKDREQQLAYASVECMTQRDFLRTVARYTFGLDERAVKRLRRYARGLWDGRTARLPEYEDETCMVGQLELPFPEPEPDTVFGETVQAWRGMLDLWKDPV
jgi:hypothetical protein